MVVECVEEFFRARCQLQHDIIVEGKYYRLRPVTSDDGPFIVQLRTDPQRSGLIHPTSPRIADQEEWLKSYFERPGDYYFILERKETQEAEGAVAVYDIDSTQRVAEWGRWVLLPGSRGAFESAILIYRVAFDVLQLDMVYCRTAIKNAQVVLFHKSIGLVTHATLPKHFNFGGVWYDAIEQRMTKEAWKKSRAALELKANWIARNAE